MKRGASPRIGKTDISRTFLIKINCSKWELPSSRTANKSSNSSQSTVNRFSTKNPRDFFDHRTANGFRAEPGFNRSITYNTYITNVIHYVFNFYLNDTVYNKQKTRNDLVSKHISTRIQFHSIILK